MNIFDEDPFARVLEAVKEMEKKVESTRAKASQRMKDFDKTDTPSPKKEETIETLGIYKMSNIPWKTRLKLVWSVLLKGKVTLRISSKNIIGTHTKYSHKSTSIH